MATVAISQRGQTADIAFEPPDPSFSLSEFHDALAEAGVTPVAVHVQVCGTTQLQPDGRVALHTGRAQFSVASALIPSDATSCVSGWLHRDSYLEASRPDRPR